MLDKQLFQLSDSKRGKLTRGSIKLLIATQILLVVLVVAGVQLISLHLRQVALDNMHSYAVAQTRNKLDRLTQSIDLLHLHLRNLINDNPAAAQNKNELLNSMIGLLTKLNYLRSVSVMDANGTIFLSTNPSNEQLNIQLEQQLPLTNPLTPDILRFSQPWVGRDFATGIPLAAADANLLTHRNFFPVTIKLPEMPQWTLLIAINSDFFINLAPVPQEEGDLIYRAFLDNGQILFSTSPYENLQQVHLPPEQLEQILHQHQGSFFWQDSNKRSYLSSYRVSYNYPWFVHTQIAKDFILHKWRQETQKLWLTSGVTLTIMLLLGSFMIWRVNRSLRREELGLERSQLAASVFLYSSDLIIIANKHRQIIAINPAFEKVTGYSAAEVLGYIPGSLEPENSSVNIYPQIWQALEQNSSWQGEITETKKDGTPLNGWMQVTVIHDENAAIRNYVGVFKDLSNLREAEQAQRLAAKVLHNISEGAIICDADKIIIEVNPAFSAITGYSSSEAVGRKPRFLGAEDSNQQASAELKAQLGTQGVWQGEFLNRHKEGSLYVIHSSINVIRDENGDITNYISIFADITASKQQQENLKKQAYFDLLTGLPNRALLNKRLEESLLSHAQEPSTCLAICFMDLDGFKQVNDTHGHQAGDELLIEIAQRLTAAVRNQDTVARLGGDEFVILLHEITSLEECSEVANRILAQVALPINLNNGHAVGVTGSMGITLYPLDASNSEQLLRHADHAMYQAKQNGRNCFIISGKATPANPADIDSKA